MAAKHYPWPRQKCAGPSPFEGGKPIDIDLRVQGRELAQFEDAIAKLGSERAAGTAYRRAINHTGDKARTAVRRALAKQIGLPQSALKKYGGYGSSRATSRSFAYEINAKGEYIPLKVFGARQFGYGVRAKPWGRSQRFPGTFIYAGHYRSGQPVSPKGDVFHRRTSASLPIEKMFGPAVPAEMVKGDSAETFGRVGRELPSRIAHEVRVLTDGVVTG